ncbi:hypothetical protein IKF76_00160 [Candidatus Saccharibacteria bacterium]|nr:hypothetical protein [Candidatus Saccharibacteria bacterium]
MSSIQKIRAKKLNNQELSAEEVVLQDLFYDLYRHRGSIYRVNFIRGVFFGLGTFIGGTIVIAVVILFLSWLMSIAPGNFHDFFQWIIQTLQHHPVA